MRHPLHLDPATTGNLDYTDTVDHLGHEWHNGVCSYCNGTIREVSTKKRCAELHFQPRQAAYCAYCGRPLDVDGCPCRTVNAIAP